MQMQFRPDPTAHAPDHSRADSPAPSTSPSTAAWHAVSRAQHGRYCRAYFIALLGAAIAIPGGINYVIDPWQYFRKSFYSADLSNNARYQSPGLARHYAYDAVILGSSQTANFYPAELKERLGVSALRLSIPGGTPYEQRRLLEIALGRGTLKHVLWGIDAENFFGPVDRVYTGSGLFP